MAQPHEISWRQKLEDPGSSNLCLFLVLFFLFFFLWFSTRYREFFWRKRPLLSSESQSTELLNSSVILANR